MEFIEFIAQDGKHFMGALLVLYLVGAIGEGLIGAWRGR